MAFCTDTDLLYWEPKIFVDGAGVAQTLVAGLAGVAGAGVTVVGVSLEEARVRPLDVICFSGSVVSGAFPIVSVDSATEMAVSVLYDGLFPSGEAVHQGMASNQQYAVRTFWPQREVVTRLLLRAAGLAEGEEEKVTNPEELKRACVLGTLQMIYSALAPSAEEPAALVQRAELYERLYRRAMRAARVEVEGGEVRALNGIGLVRG